MPGNQQLRLGTQWVDLIAGRPASQPPGPGQTRYSESFATHISLHTKHRDRGVIQEEQEEEEEERREERGEEKMKTDILM